MMRNEEEFRRWLIGATPGDKAAVVYPSRWLNRFLDDATVCVFHRITRRMKTGNRRPTSRPSLYVQRVQALKIVSQNGQQFDPKRNRNVKQLYSEGLY